jgi:tRNA (guanine37-N1)-methyltransferase
MLQIDIITIFPRLFDSFVEESMVGIAIRSGQLCVEVHDLRHWATDPHRSVDDSPYGGGAGMVMKPEPLVAAVESLAGPKGPERSARVIALSPQGARLGQSRLVALAEEERLVLVCGRYEGIDQRVIEVAIDEEISIGDYVLSGGEVPAMAVIEGISRFLPGVLGNPESLNNESFQGPVLEGPQYTRPAEFRGQAVPPVLLSGDHGAIARWREKQSIEYTRKRRPDLLDAREGDKQS